MNCFVAKPACHKLMVHAVGPFFLLHVISQVQNMTQSIQTLDQRTQKDLQYVQRMEVQLRGLETKFKQVEESHKQNIAKQYKVRSNEVLIQSFCLIGSIFLLIYKNMHCFPLTKSCFEFIYVTACHFKHAHPKLPWF